MKWDLSTHTRGGNQFFCIKCFFFIFPFLFFSCKKNIENETPQQIRNAQSSLKKDSTASDDYLGTYVATEQNMQTVNAAPPNYIYGYTDKVSYSPGDKMDIYLSAPLSLIGNSNLSIKDVNGQIVQTFNCSITNQTISNTKPWVNGLGFTKTATITLNQSLKSGFYTIGNAVHFIIKGNPSSYYDFTVVYPSNTVNAYSASGGKSLYSPGPYVPGYYIGGRSFVVSFLRYQGEDGYSMPFLKWLSYQPYSVNYIADDDLDNYQNISNSQVLMIIGHSEYWTRQARENVDRFVAEGHNMLVLSGNTMWWQVRYNQPKDLMICYKDKTSDPLRSTPYATINWPDSSLNYPTTSSIGADFKNGGYGHLLPKRLNGYKIVNEKSPLLEGTGLKNGDILLNPTYEYDGAPLKYKVLPGSSEIPVIDNDRLHFYKIELIGYDFTLQNKTSLAVGNSTGVATFIVFQKSPTSGVVVNTASENWCYSIESTGADYKRIQQITKNMIDKSLAGKNLFTE